MFKNHVVTCSGFKRTLDANKVSFSYLGDRFSCDTCCLSWTSKGEFEEHLVCHILDSPYICLTCKQSFNSRDRIEQHINTSHALGEARCGLKGIRKGRQHVEDLMVKKKLIVTGKVNILKTPQTPVAPVAVLTSTPTSGTASVTSTFTMLTSASTIKTLSTGTASVSTIEITSSSTIKPVTTTAMASSSTIKPVTSTALSSASTIKPLSTGTASVSTIAFTSSSTIKPVTTTASTSSSTIKPLSSGTASVSTIALTSSSTIKPVTTTALQSSSTIKPVTTTALISSSTIQPSTTGTPSVSTIAVLSLAPSGPPPPYFSAHSVVPGLVKNVTSAVNERPAERKLLPSSNPYSAFQLTPRTIAKTAPHVPSTNNALLSATSNISGTPSVTSSSLKGKEGNQSYMFGVMNPKTKEIEPTYVSKKIFNVLNTANVHNVPLNPKPEVQYSCHPYRVWPLWVPLSNPCSWYFQAQLPELMLEAFHGLDVPVKAVTQEGEVIEIIDDEPETSSASPKDKPTEIIVLDDDIDKGEDCEAIIIGETCSVVQANNDGKFPQPEQDNGTKDQALLPNTAVNPSPVKSDDHIGVEKDSKGENKDDDKNVDRDLLNKSLTYSSEAETESAVAEVIDSNLKTYDPRQTADELGKILEDAIIPAPTECVAYSYVCGHCGYKDYVEDSHVRHMFSHTSMPAAPMQFADKKVILEHIKLCHPDKMRMVTVTGQVVCCERDINFYVVPKSKKASAQDGGNVDKTASEPSNIDIPALLDKVQNSDTTNEPERMETHEQESGNEDVSDEISLPEADQPLMKERQKNAESLAAKNVEDNTKSCSQSVACKNVQDKANSNSNVLKAIHDSTGPKCLLCRHPGYIPNICQFMRWNQNGIDASYAILEKWKQHSANHSNMKSHINDHCKDAHSPASMYSLKPSRASSEQLVQHENAVHKVKPKRWACKRLKPVRPTQTPSKKTARKSSTLVVNLGGVTTPSKKYTSALHQEIPGSASLVKEAAAQHEFEIEGAIERTLLHNLEPLIYTTVQFKDRIFSQNFSDDLGVTASEAQQSTRPTDHGLKTEPVREVTHKLDLHNKGPASEKKENKAANFGTVRKCPLCRYATRGLTVLTNHIAAHNDPLKRFLCSECDYRADRYSVIKHVYRVCHPNPAKVIEVDEAKLSACISNATKAEDLGESGVKPTVVETKLSSSSELERKRSSEDKSRGEKLGASSVESNTSSHTFVLNSSGQQTPLESFTVSKSVILNHLIHLNVTDHITSALNVPLKVQPRWPLENMIRQDNPVANLLRKQMKNESKFLPDVYKDDYDESPQQVNVHSSVIKCCLCLAYHCPNLSKLQYHMNTVHQGDMLHCTAFKNMFNHCKTVHMQDRVLYSSKNADLTTEVTSFKSSREWKSPKSSTELKSPIRSTELLPAIIPPMQDFENGPCRYEIVKDKVLGNLYKCLLCEELIPSERSLHQHYTQQKRVVNWEAIKGLAMVSFSQTELE
ncbi:hypothetical protein DPMN_009126 [Dreissena polymorpha]|uniref:C2H2-type domain-containing protein n=1 Tax=Dreissena polymorpha TaxID=45954 RepID=A0A9D4RXQ2_DREPO|nr:hypothetical protein DPMN_009126 [Dreissena polymorpha]